MLNVSEMTREQLEAFAISAMAASKPKALTIKVSEKGAVSVYGMGKWPVTLYRGQWERLFENRAQIEAFIKANAQLLSVKA